VAFVRRKGNVYYLVHNVRRRGKIEQIHLATLGERPRITDDVMRSVSRDYPSLELNWAALRERINARVELFDIRSPYVQTLIQALRIMNLDLADLPPPLLSAGHEELSRELATQLRLLRSTLDTKLDQLERTRPRAIGASRKFR
jgi:hypothetical protein